jgi:RimJ/RimL family protein N-acetyltransferase
MPAPTLTDGVVTLRAHRGDDVPRVVEQGRDREMQQWTQVPVPYDEADARQFVGELVPGWWADGSEWAFAVEVGGEFGGTVSLRDEGDGRLEVAFGAHPSVRGTGAMERALRLLLEWGFTEQAAETVVWRAFVGNWGSRRLAWRLGFVMEGTLRHYLPHRGTLRDAWVGTLLKDDPREPRTTWLDVPELVGEGYRLRPIRDGDAQRIQEGSADPESQRWLGQLPAPYTLDDARDYIAMRRELAAAGQAVTWAIADPVDDRLLGTILWFHWTAGVECEIGYWTHPEARGRGLMTAVVRQVTSHVFETLEVRRVTAFAAADNTASRRVIEKAGFRLYGIARYAAWVRDDRVDLALYDVTASEWSDEWSESGRSSAKATASTANPATDSTAPISSGER